jgi:probable HAF family extracellular repeat protein
MRAITKIALILSLVLSCTSCGGGGGGGNGPPPPPPPPSANQAPTVDAGADQSVEEGTTVNLSATGTDSDGTIASYTWQQEDGPDVTLTNADTANASFVVPIVEHCTDLHFRVTVTDDDGATGSDTVIVNAVKSYSPAPSSADFIPLGAYNLARDVSADGSVVVGTGCGAWGKGVFRWTSAGGMMAVGDLPGGPVFSGHGSVSDDGNVVVGTSRSESGIEAFRWTAASGMVGLGDLPGGLFESEANGVSADGNVVVGNVESESGDEAFRWTAASGMVGLGDLPGGEFHSVASAASADGGVIVGSSAVGDSCCTEAFRWTAATGMVSLAQTPGTVIDSGANDVSADGSVIVGGSGNEAALWTSAGGMMGLGYLPGRDGGSTAWGISADGTVVVGVSRADDVNQTREAFIWTQVDGMQSLRDVLIAKGVPGLDNWVLIEAESISADGEWVVGRGINPGGFAEGFLADISAP